MTFKRDEELWYNRARALLGQALAEFDEVDCIPTVSAAEAALRIANGEMDPAEMDGYPFPDEELELPCVCPPDLLARGGYRGGCPAHSLVRA